MLKVERLTKTYFTAAGPLTVLKDVTLEVAAGDTLAVIGLPAAARRPCLACVPGSTNRRRAPSPSNGANLERLSEDERALLRNADVGFVFQNFQLIPTLTALKTSWSRWNCGPVSDGTRARGSRRRRPSRATA